MDLPSDDHPDMDDEAWAVGHQRATAIRRPVLIDGARLRAGAICSAAAEAGRAFTG
ncbi:MAG TPA: hypothetical protein VMU82_11810 [Acetobacteraceae bacterium]|nr:hypothetical protein [Acetobacteraceae bacterium]